MAGTERVELGIGQPVGIVLFALACSLCAGPGAERRRLRHERLVFVSAAFRAQKQFLQTILWDLFLREPGILPAGLIGAQCFGEFRTFTRFYLAYSTELCVDVDKLRVFLISRPLMMSGAVAGCVERWWRSTVSQLRLCSLLALIQTALDCDSVSRSSGGET